MPWALFAVLCVVISATNSTDTTLHLLHWLAIAAPVCSMLTVIVAHLIKQTPQPKRSLPILLTMAAIFNGSLYGIGWIFLEALSGINC